jgi:hypothetical protein
MVFHDGSPSLRFAQPDSIRTGSDNRRSTFNGIQDTLKNREELSPDMDAVEEIYDHSHSDSIAACMIGKTMARMWAMKLKADFPNERFGV